MLWRTTAVLLALIAANAAPAERARLISSRRHVGRSSETLTLLPRWQNDTTIMAASRHTGRRHVIAQQSVAEAIVSPTSSPRIVIADKSSREWLGGGKFAGRSRSLYARLSPGSPVHIARAASVHALLQNFSLPVAFSLERLGWASAGVDWALVDWERPGGVAELARRYDLVLAFPPLLKRESLGHGTTGRVVTFLDEPLPYADPQTALEAARRAGGCSRCAVAHFYSPDPRVYPLAPPYLPRLFDPYADLPGGKPRLFFMQKRSMYAEATAAELVSMGYAPVPTAARGGPAGGSRASAVHSESWSFTGPMNTADYLRRLSGCKWVLNLDLKQSAGQVSAEASLLGVPTISVRGKANPDRLLPPQLLLPRSVSQAQARAAVRRIIEFYDANPEEYARLADEVRRTAARVLTPPPRAHLFGSLVGACCEESNLTSAV